MRCGASTRLPFIWAPWLKGAGSATLRRGSVVDAYAALPRRAYLTPAPYARMTPSRKMRFREILPSTRAIVRATKNEIALFLNRAATFGSMAGRRFPEFVDDRTPRFPFADAFRRRTVECWFLAFLALGTPIRPAGPHRHASPEEEASASLGGSYAAIGS